MNKHLAVLGTGAIGSSVGADLTRAGNDVILIDQWPAHVEAMKNHGLSIKTPIEEYHTPVRAYHICELASLKPHLDIVFLTPKSYDSCWMAELIKSYLSPEGLVVSAQNSMNDEWIAPIIGKERDIACVVELSAEEFDPGKVIRNTDHTRTTFVVGELDGRTTPRVQEIARIMSAVGNIETSTNIQGAKWTKLIYQAMVPLDIILGVWPRQTIDNPRILKVSVQLGREAAKVGASLGYKMEPLFGMTAEDMVKSTDDIMENILRKFFTNVTPGNVRSHRLQDIMKGRRTEVDYLSGLVARKGREAGIAAPFNEAVTSIVHQIEQGKLKASLSNLELFEKL